MNIAFKRFLAYLIDMLIIFIIMFGFKNMYPNKYENEFIKLNQELLENKIEIKEYNDLNMKLVHNCDKENIFINVINTILIIILFVIIPFLLKGQTIGQKLLKIKISKTNFHSYVGRAVIINGLGYMFFMFVILYLVNDKIYFYLINILGFIQILLVIINSFMVLYRKDKCGIADIFTNTRIEELK